MDTDNKLKDRYFVAVKVFLEDSEGRLLILKDSFGQWDLPGGRIKIDEFESPLVDVVKRKMTEELGSDFNYTFDVTPKIFMRHRREEKVGDENEARIFALGFLGKLLNGELRLSPAHSEMLWVDLKGFAPEIYFSGGWLKGVEEYINFKKGNSI